MLHLCYDLVFVETIRHALHKHGPCLVRQAYGLSQISDLFLCLLHPGSFQPAFSRNAGSSHQINGPGQIQGYILFPGHCQVLYPRFLQKLGHSTVGVGAVNMHLA